MKKIDEKELLSIPEVVEEIKRHLWIESEKAGYDIGFETAAKDWIKRFAKAWLEYHMPNTKISSNNGDPKANDAVKKRRAKSYTIR